MPDAAMIAIPVLCFGGLLGYLFRWNYYLDLAIAAMRTARRLQWEGGEWTAYRDYGNALNRYAGWPFMRHPVLSIAPLSPQARSSPADAGSDQPQSVGVEGRGESPAPTTEEV